MVLGTSYQPWDPVVTLSRYALELTKPQTEDQE